MEKVKGVLFLSAYFFCLFWAVRSLCLIRVIFSVVLVMILVLEESPLLYPFLSVVVLPCFPQLLPNTKVICMVYHRVPHMGPYICWIGNCCYRKTLLVVDDLPSFHQSS